MVLSNNERVGKALELLNSGLSPFVQRQMQDVYGSRAAEVVRATLQRNEGRTLAGAEDGQWDTQAVLALMWERWNDVFRNALGPVERSLVSELRDVRNSWAHQRVFSTDDTYRAIDSIHRLLKVVRSDQAADVETYKQELLRLRFEEQRNIENKQVEPQPVEPAPTQPAKPVNTISGIDSALDLLQSGESAVVLFTRGRHLMFNSDGTGSSGNWVMSADHHPDKVILYWRSPEQLSPGADIYLADYADSEQSPERGRRIVRFRAAKQVGTTQRNWPEFADTGTGPVRYLRKL